MKHKKSLYINIGNTNVSFAISFNDNINDLKIEKILTSSIKNDMSNKILMNIFSKYIEQIEDVYISSVVSSLNDLFKNFFEKEFNIVPKFISYKNVPVDLSLLYNPYQLGNDILIQSFYVSNFTNEAIVVSAGTSCVIYHIKDKKISGCIILPGISQSQELISSKTDIHNFEFVETDKVLGLNTNEAISIGIINNIVNIVNNIKKKFNTNCPVICSGGDLNFLAKEKDWWFIENLEIFGLYIFSNNI